MSISITDNFVAGMRISNKKDVINIKRIEGKSLCQLTTEFDGLLVYPSEFGMNNDGLNGKDKILCTLDGGNTLRTGNIMGYISIPSEDGTSKTVLHIGSRFDASYEKKDNGRCEFSKLNKNSFFIHYLLYKTGYFNITDWNYSSGASNIFDDLKLLIFPRALSNALSQGLYKEYKRFEKNDPNIRGAIDVNRHLHQNIPFQGNVAYNSREFSYDNNITQLIRHTIEYLKTKEIGKSLLREDCDFQENVSVINAATPSYDKNQLITILNKNTRPKIHPFYSEYTSLQRLCIEILNEEAISYGNSNDEVHGILFDGAWLWETYLFTILEKLGFKHPDNIAKRDAFKLFAEDGQEDDLLFNPDMYPDFYNDKCVLDAKYKHLEKKVQRNDLYQVISYMHTIPRNFGGYIYPFQSENEETNVEHHNFILNGMGGTIMTIPFKIPSSANNNWKKYKEEMNKQEAEFEKTTKCKCDEATMYTQQCQYVFS